MNERGNKDAKVQIICKALSELLDSRLTWHSQKMRRGMRRRTNGGATNAQRASYHIGNALDEQQRNLYRLPMNVKLVFKT